MSASSETAVEVVDLVKHYGPVVAVRSVSLRIASGQYFVLLGPSGGGKTTLLRLIGGFLRPTSGKVLLHGQARYTAEFIGEKNLLQGRVVSSGDGVTGIDLGYATVRVTNAGKAIETGADVSLSIPSERIFLVDGPGDGMECLTATFVERLFLGLTNNDVVRLADGTDLLIRSLASDAAPDVAEGAQVTVAWKRGDARLHTF